MDEIFRALGSPLRRKILDRLYNNTGQSVHDLCARFDMSRQAMDKQLGILVHASLVVQTGVREEKRFWVDPAPIVAAAGHFFPKFISKEYPLRFALDAARKKQVPRPVHRR